LHVPLLHTPTVPGGPLVQSVFTQQLVDGMQTPLHMRWDASHGNEQEVMLLHTPVVPAGPPVQSVLRQQFPDGMQAPLQSRWVASHG
jgi:hypothetical protein